MVREHSNFETERRNVFNKILMKIIEMVTTYILDPINSVFNYVIYSMYFDRLLDNGPYCRYKLDFQTITYNRLPWLPVTVLSYVMANTCYISVRR